MTASFFPYLATGVCMVASVEYGGGAVVRLSQGWLTGHQDASGRRDRRSALGWVLGICVLFSAPRHLGGCPLGNGVPSWFSACSRGRKMETITGSCPLQPRGMAVHGHRPNESVESLPRRSYQEPPRAQRGARWSPSTSCSWGRGRLSHNSSDFPNFPFQLKS